MNRVLLAMMAAVMLCVTAVGCERHSAPSLAFNAKNVSELRRQMDKSAKTEVAAAAVTAEPTGWATFKGKFVLNGPAPPRPPLKVDKDLEVCAAPGVQLTNESLVIGPDNGIQNVLVYLTSVIPADNPKWIHESYDADKTAEVAFDQKNCRFLSHVFAMRATQKLKVLNSDPVGHNTNLNSTRGTIGGNFTVPGLGSVTHDPKKSSPLPFSVACSIHPWMNAWMMVTDNPYFAVTKEDGSFEIKNVPAGVPLEFRAWQEKSGYLQTVSVDGKVEKWNRGKFVKTFNADSPLEINVSVEVAIFNK